MNRVKFLRRFFLIIFLLTVLVNIYSFYQFQSPENLLLTYSVACILSMIYSYHFFGTKKGQMLFFSLVGFIFIYALYVLLNRFIDDLKPLPSILKATINFILISFSLGLILKNNSESRLNLNNLQFSFLILFILAAYSFLTLLAQIKTDTDFNFNFVIFLLSGSSLFVLREIFFRNNVIDNFIISDTNESSLQYKSLQNPEAIKEKIALFFQEDKSFTNPDFAYKDFLKALPFSQKEISTYLNHYQKTSFYNLLGEERAKYAAKQIKSSHLYTIEGIMLEAGFKSYSSFVKYFKRVYGISPSQYRSKYFQ